MKLNGKYFVTKKEDVKDEDTISTNLLIRAGLIKKVGSGLYSYLPMGLRVLEKLEKLIREELNSIGSQELLIPNLIPEAYYNDSERSNDNLFKITDKINRKYYLGFSYEELVIDTCRDMIKSYKNMPLSLYQITDKYEDRELVKSGLLNSRGYREIDCYSFNKDIDELDMSYDLMKKSFENIFNKLNLDYKIMKSYDKLDTMMLTEDFDVISEIGNNKVVCCDKCGLTTNIEICECSNKVKKSREAKLDKELIHTPDCGTINDLCEKYNINPEKMCKTLIYKIDGKFYALMIRGDRELNEIKVLRLLGGKTIEMATPEEDEEITHAKVGFAGPIGLDIPIIIDNEVLGMKNFLIGANKSDYHYINTNLDDFTYENVADIRYITSDDICPECGAKLTIKNSINAGSLSKIGTKYTSKLNLNYLDENNEFQVVYMGSYKINLNKLLALYVEANHDDAGIIFNEDIAPYEMAIVIANTKDEEQVKIGNELYDKFKSKGIDVLLDDRSVGAGIKFKDMDLLGIPERIVVGKFISEGLVEVKTRKTGDLEKVSISKL